MVVNILEPTRSMERPLDYNGTKVALGVASVLCVSGISSDSEEDIRNTFRRYENAVWSSRNISFHMSINPGEGEEMDDSTAAAYASRLMKELGYEKQPFVVYKHEDIERVHYHVVSIRTDLNGRKIKDYYENRRCLEAMKSLASEFGYMVGHGEKVGRKELDIIRFDPQRGDVVNQMKALFADCLKYRFTSLEQFRIILWAHGMAVEDRTGFTTKLYLQGLGPDGRPCTGKITEREMGMRLYGMYSDRAIESVNEMAVMRRERERVCGCVKGPLENCTSFLHFRRAIAKSGIDIRIARDPHTLEIAGGHLVDHTNRCAFRLSELAPGLTMDMVMDADHERWSRPDVQEERQMEDRPDNTLGDILSGLGGGGSKSREKDMKDKKKKKKLGMRV